MVAQCPTAVLYNQSKFTFRTTQDYRYMPTCLETANHVWLCVCLQASWRQWSQRLGVRLGSTGKLATEKAKARDLYDVTSMSGDVIQILVTDWLATQLQINVKWRQHKSRYPWKWNSSSKGSRDGNSSSVWPWKELDGMIGIGRCAEK